MANSVANQLWSPSLSLDKLSYELTQTYEESERKFVRLLEKHRQEGKLGKVDFEYFSRSLRDRASLLLTFKFVRRQFRDSFILDLGCGMGAWETEMCQDENYECVGLDANTLFVRLASQRMRLHGYANVSFVVADVRTLPFRKQTFNLVILHDVAFTVKLNSLLGGVANVLSRRGRFVFDVPLALFYRFVRVKRPFIKYSRAEVITALTHSGFEEESVFLPGLPPTLHEYFNMPEWLLRAISGLLTSLPQRLQGVLGEFWFTLVFVVRVK